MPRKSNTLCYGDNLAMLRKHIADESVDLVYLDPPFNSKKNFNLIFRDRGGKKATSQELIFADTWTWNENAAEACRELIEAGGRLAEVMKAFRSFLGTSDMMAYLAMMAPRLVELRRVLKETGSIYLHCDSTASHYLKILMDAVFGPEEFTSEIIWKRTNAHSDAKRWSPISDTLLYYTMSDSHTWNAPYVAHDESYVASKYRHKDADGRLFTLDNMTSPNPRPNMTYEWKGFTPPPFGWRYSRETMAQLDANHRIWYPTDKTKRPRLKRYLDEMQGVLMSNVWTDISPINSQAQERLGYPTQKPESLLERIIKASSNEGDVILDPFCGCGTTIQVAERSRRRWIGIDITYLSLAIIKQRLANEFGPDVFKTIEILEEPVNEEEALALASRDKFGFQCWAVGRLGVPPIEHKKGADRGIDGRIHFHDDLENPKEIIISVKAGEHIGPQFVRELRGVIEREKAEMGILVCAKEPTSEMKRDAIEAGVYKTLGGSFPRLQIMTIKDIFADKAPNIPGRRSDPFERKSPASVAGLRKGPTSAFVRPAAYQLRLLP